MRILISTHAKSQKVTIHYIFILFCVRIVFYSLQGAADGNFKTMKNVEFGFYDIKVLASPNEASHLGLYKFTGHRA